MKKKHNQPQPKAPEIHIFSPQRYEGWLQNIDGEWTFCRDSALRNTPKTWHCSPDEFKAMNPSSSWTYLNLKQTPQGCQVYRDRGHLGTVRFSTDTKDWIAFAGNQEHHFNYRYEAIALVLCYPQAIAC